MERKNNCMDISRDKLTKSHMRRHEDSKETETLRDKQNV